MNVKKITAAVLTAALLCSLTACGGEEPVTVPKGTAVEVAAVEKTDMASKNTVNGMVTAKNTVAVVPMLSGIVEELNVAEGDLVTEGDVLLQIDTSTVTGTYGALASSYSSSKAAVNAGIEAAQKQLDLAKTNYENSLALFEIGAASQLEVDSAKAQYDGARLQIEQARAQGNASLSSIQAQMSQITTQAGLGTVTAPVSGKVISVSASVGTIAGQSAAVIIAEGGETRVSVSVSENMLSAIQVGDTAELRLSSLSDEVYAAEIESIAMMINQQTGLYDVELIPPAELDCPIGLFATVTFCTDSRENVVAVPTESILNDGKEEYVFVVEGENAHRVAVTTGLIGEELTEITSGLAGGETLVVKGQSYLTEGSHVRVVGEN